MFYQDWDQIVLRKPVAKPKEVHNAPPKSELKLKSDEPECPKMSSELGKEVVALRCKLKMNQKELAQKLINVSVKEIIELERGKMLYPKARTILNRMKQFKIKCETK